VKLRIRSRATAAILVWLFGLIIICWLIPVGPRDGWQPPRDEFVCGLLNDGRTIVTVPIRPNQSNASIGRLGNGPIRLWDTEAGTLRATHFTAQDWLHFVWVSGAHDWLIVSQLDGGSAGHNYCLRVLEALTGREVSSFKCHVPDDNVLCIFARDGRSVGLVNYDNAQPHIELFDVSSGKLLQTLSGWQHPGQFSADGCRFAASRLDQDTAGVFISTIGVWEVASGNKLVEFSQRLAKPSDQSVPSEFSPNGEFLLDNRYQV
jgi:WD40 repeat protein